MYKIRHNQDLNILEIQDSKNKVYGKIYLNQGASLQELVLNNKVLIEDLTLLKYSSTYASSILFPFANRIKDGQYNFDKEKYAFEINEVANNNALHGLVFDKTFKILDQTANENYASIKLIYDERNESIGFPYTYSIQLEYIISKNTLDLKVKITNTHSKSFPFTLGWHPYFISKKLSESHLTFNSSKKLVFDDRMITSGTKDENIASLKIENKQLDDCWVLDNTKVVFKTPDYNLQILSTEKNSFLQAYTPPRKNTIAIEPTTGVSNSFNNKMGLQTLDPKDSYQLTWTLKLD